MRQGDEPLFRAAEYSGSGARIPPIRTARNNVRRLPPGGTVVTIWLPRSKKSATDVAGMGGAKVGEVSETGSLRVLLVDDDVLVSMGAADMLLEQRH